MTSAHHGHRPPRILLLGASGQVGWELQRTLAPLGDLVAACYEGRFGPKVDLTKADELTALIEEVKPDALVNAAAYTAVDRAEDERELAQQINGDAPGLMGRLLAERGVPVIHYSTDFVFSGEATRPYREDDATGPLNVYGETKLAGEQALLASGAKALIFRTSWVYGVHGHNFLLTMLRLFREREALKVVDDQVGAPTWSRMLAEVAAQVLYRILRGDLEIDAARGLYHLTGGGQVSWFGFACAILEASHLGCALDPIPSSEYQTPARRPAYSVLDNDKLRRTFGLSLPDWRYSLKQCLADLD